MHVPTRTTEVHPKMTSVYMHLSDHYLSRGIKHSAYKLLLENIIQPNLWIKLNGPYHFFNIIHVVPRTPLLNPINLLSLVTLPKRN